MSALLTRSTSLSRVLMFSFISTCSFSTVHLVYLWNTLTAMKNKFWCLPVGRGGGAQEHPGLLSPVRGLPGAAGRQAVLPEQLRQQKPDGPDRGGDQSVHLAARPGPPAPVHEQLSSHRQNSETGARFNERVFVSLRETSGKVSGLREKLDDVNWTVGAVNHTFSNDISVHNLKIQDLQVRHRHIEMSYSSNHREDGEDKFTLVLLLRSRSATSRRTPAVCGWPTSTRRPSWGTRWRSSTPSLRTSAWRTGSTPSPWRTSPSLKVRVEPAAPRASHLPCTLIGQMCGCEETTRYCFPKRYCVTLSMIAGFSQSISSTVVCANLHIYNISPAPPALRE